MGKLGTLVLLTTKPSASISGGSSLHYEENKALFMKRFPKMDKKYANSDLIRWHSKVFGACDEGTALFLKEKRIPYFGKMTLVEFFDTIRGGFHSWLVADLENEYKRL